MLRKRIEELETFLSDQAQEEEHVQREIDSYPDMVELKEHSEHPLKKTVCMYSSGSYRCNVCNWDGCGYVYHCEECNFDAHPQCAMKALAGTVNPEECNAEY
jgi:hypothetical protein